MGKIGLYVDWLQQVLSVQENMYWVNINSYEKFKAWFVENKEVPHVISVGFQLSEEYQRWMLDTENEEKPIDYPSLGSGSVMSCLTFLYHLCLKNSLPFPEIWIHTEYEMGVWDIRRFIELICRKHGWTPSVKIKQLEIKDDWEQGENWQIFLKIKEEFALKNEE